jgi:hypothetical protein
MGSHSRECDGVVEAFRTDALVARPVVSICPDLTGA